MFYGLPSFAQEMAQIKKFKGILDTVSVSYTSQEEVLGKKLKFGRRVTFTITVGCSSHIMTH
jgi:hypothetical protein